MGALWPRVMDGSLILVRGVFFSVNLGLEDATDRCRMRLWLAEITDATLSGLWTSDA